MLLSYYSNDLYSALQIAFQGAAPVTTSIRDSGVQRLLDVDDHLLHPGDRSTSRRVMLDLYLTQRFMMRWRVWLTRRLT